MPHTSAVVAIVLMNLATIVVSIYAIVQSNRPIVRFAMCLTLMISMTIMVSTWLSFYGR